MHVVLASNTLRVPVSMLLSLRKMAICPQNFSNALGQRFADRPIHTSENKKIRSRVAYFYRYHYTPNSTEQGIISAEQGILGQEQGISWAKPISFLRVVFGTYSSETFRYDPLPTALVSRRRPLRSIYFDGAKLRPLSLANLGALSEL